MGFECSCKFKIGRKITVGNQKVCAIVLAAGQGKRMKSSVQKQYMLLKEHPILYYSLKVFEDREEIEKIVLVVGKGEISYCRREIVEKYGFQKVTDIIEGGKERYHSVYEGIKSLKEECDYVLIHDGARPFITGDMIINVIESVKKYGACAVGMPVKDTIKIVNEEDFCVHTPERARVWAMQTPQAFEYKIIKSAYDKLMQKEIMVTDDAMVVEQFMNIPVKLIKGTYENIKITTQEDWKIAEALMEE